MRPLTRRALLTSVPVLGLGAVAGYVVWREHTLPPYRPPRVRHPRPAIGDEVRLVALGDWGSGTRPQAEVAEGMDRAADEVGGIHGGLFLGDNFYNDGIVDAFDDQLRWKFEEVYDRPWLARVPWYAVLGNHDYHGDPRAQVAYTARSGGRWHMPHEYFRVDLPGPERPIATLLGLDTNARFDRWDAQIAWLEAELRSLRDAEHPVLAFGHNPILSYCRKRNRIERQMPERILPLFRKYPVVDLYLSGHAHQLEMIEHDDLRLAVLGGGGKRLHPSGDGPGSLFHRSAFGFGLLRIRRDGIRLEIRDRAARSLHVWHHETGARVARAG